MRYKLYIERDGDSKLLGRYYSMDEAAIIAEKDEYEGYDYVLIDTDDLVTYQFTSEWEIL